MVGGGWQGGGRLSQTRSPKEERPAATRDRGRPRRRVSWARAARPAQTRGTRRRARGAGGLEAGGLRRTRDALGPGSRAGEAAVAGEQGRGPGERRRAGGRSP